MRSALKRFMQEEDGATAIEYALLAAGISAVIATVVYTLGGRIQAVFQRLAGTIR